MCKDGTVTQDVGGPCLSRKQAVCARLLSELMIENPPTSSTSTFAFVRSGPLLETSTPRSALGSLALFRDGAVAGFFIFFFFLLRGVLEWRLEEDDDDDDGGGE